MKFNENDEEVVYVGSIKELVKDKFKALDERLKELGGSDSSVEYAPHIREEFNNVINGLNNIKVELGIDILESDEYFK